VFFPTHLAAGYLLGRGAGLAPLWVVAGAALPDALDKPLAMVGVTGLYHSVGHALLFGLPLLAAWTLARHRGRWLALAAGWASHLALDAVHVVVNGRPTDALFLTWPVLVPPDPLGLAPIPFALQYLWTPAFFLELAVWAGLAVVLHRRFRPAEWRGQLKAE
jgi:hypothetical protein